jgi:hypothetical protein
MWTRQDVAHVGAQLHRALESSVLVAIDPHDLEIGIRTQYSATPERSYSRRLIVSSRLRVDGEPISTTISGAPVTCVAVRMSAARCRDTNRQVGFHHVEIGEHDVERCHEDSSSEVLFQPGSDEEVKVPQNGLMPDVRREKVTRDQLRAGRYLTGR